MKTKLTSYEYEILFFLCVWSMIGLLFTKFIPWLYQMFCVARYLMARGPIPGRDPVVGGRRSIGHWLEYL